jgi:glycosyltransferase involved in cell wall biosynthesis
MTCVSRSADVPLEAPHGLAAPSTPPARAEPAEITGGRRLVRRVLFCTWGYAPDQVGGAEHQARLQAEELTRRGCAVEVVCPRRRGTRSGQVNRVFVTRLPFIDRRPLRTASYCLALLCFLVRRLGGFALVHVHLAYFQADVAAVAAFVRRRPVWVKVAASGALGEVARMRRAAGWTRYLGLRTAAVVQAVSLPVAEEVRGIGVRPERLVRLPNGVDTSRFRPAGPSERRRLREALGLPPDVVLVMYAGRFARHKGVEDLLQAWSRVEAGDARLVLVGSRETIDPVPEVCIGRGMIVRGWAEDMADYCRAVDALALPSTHSEGMSNALLEAMGCGLAVVATRVGAAAEMIRDGVDGLLVAPGDPPAMAAALERIVSDGALRARLGREAVRTVRSRYAIERVVDGLERGYRAVVGA